MVKYLYNENKRGKIMKKLIADYWANAKTINLYLIGLAIGILFSEIGFLYWVFNYAINYIY